MYSSDNTVWDVMQISAKLNNYTIHSLNCGSSYFFKMKAKSTFGDSVFSDIVKMQTTGGGKCDYRIHWRHLVDTLV